MIRIRVYDRCDEALLHAMTLSRRSLYQRFFVGTPHIPAFYPRSLAGVDHVDREALVALAGTEPAGVGEYVRDIAEPHVADLAVIVADAWQRRGVARRLVSVLAGLARTRGITELRADVLASNAAARSAVRSGWPSVTATRGDGDMIVFRLPLGPGMGG